MTTTTLDAVSSTKHQSDDRSAEAAAADELVRMAKERGLALTAPNPLLKLFPKNVLKTALDEELTEHLGGEKNRADPDREPCNIRYATRPKTVSPKRPVRPRSTSQETGTERSSRPCARKRRRRLNGVAEIALSLYANGLTTGEINAHLAKIYGA